MDVKPKICHVSIVCKISDFQMSKYYTDFLSDFIEGVWDFRSLVTPYVEWGFVSFPMHGITITLAFQFKDAVYYIDNS